MPDEHVEVLRQMGLYTSDSAAEYLDMHRESLMHHRRQGHIDPYGPVGLLYTQQMLDDFKRQHMVPEDVGYTKKEAAELWGVSASNIQHRLGKGQIKAIGKRGNMWIFSESELRRNFGPPLHERSEDPEQEQEE